MTTEPVSSGKKWRDFLQHLGPYVIVIGTLGVINLITSPGYPWFLWPAIAWGIGLAFHFFSLVLEGMDRPTGKWRDFLKHIGSYVIVIGALGMMNLLTGSYPWFLWPALGWGIGLAIHFWSTLVGDDTHEETEAQTEQTEQEWFRTREPAAKPEAVFDITLQAHLERAYAYKDQINALVESTPPGEARRRVQELAGQVSEWIDSIEDLTRRIDDFQQNDIIQQDLETTPQAIAKLEAQLAGETDQATRAELERTLTNRRKQLAILEQLQSLMRRAEIKLESTLSSLGTLYSQMLTSQSTNHVADYEHLSAEVDEEVETVQDYLEALEEVKLGRV